MRLTFTHGLVASLLILLLLREGCHFLAERRLQKSLERCQAEQPTVMPVNVVRVDSVPVHDTVPVPVPVPVAYIPKGWVKAGSVVPPVIDDHPEPAGSLDSAYVAYLIRIKDDYFSRVAYKRTIPTPYGNVYADDTTFQNRLQEGHVTLDLAFPETTVTKTVAAKPRNQVWVGLHIQGGRRDYLSAYGPSLQFQSKGGVAYQAAALYTPANAWLLQAGVLYKISFTKK